LILSILDAETCTVEYKLMSACEIK
jgi:hypothetical protein